MAASIGKKSRLSVRSLTLLVMTHENILFFLLESKIGSPSGLNSLSHSIFFDLNSWLRGVHYILAFYPQ